MKAALFQKGMRIGRYQIERLIAHGTSTEIYLAKDAESGAEVSLRCLDTRRTREPALTEARFRAGLDRVLPMKGPNIPAVLGGGVYEGVLWLASQHKKGEVLEIVPGEPYYVYALASGTTIIDALEAAYTNFGVIHGDLRPDSIFIDDCVEKNLLGIGCADLFGLTRTLARSTPLYRSPEQLSGRAPVTFLSDIYSVGMIVYALIAGRLPFADKHNKLPDKLAQVALAEHGGPSLLTPLPAVLGRHAEVAWQVVQYAIHPNPEKRFSSWAQMRLVFINATQYYLKNVRPERVQTCGTLVELHDYEGFGAEARAFVANAEPHKPTDIELQTDDFYQ